MSSIDNVCVIFRSNPASHFTPTPIATHTLANVFSQYAIYRTQIISSVPGPYSCHYRNKNSNPENEIIRDIPDLGSDAMRVILSPGFDTNQNYPDETLVIYNIKCPDDKPFAYFNITHMDLEGKCEDR